MGVPLPQQPATSPSPFETLAAEALTSRESEDDEDLESKAQRALECPCVAELREGPCGKAFSAAFVCFLKSTAEEKGSDCIKPFLAMQACMLENPDAFSKDEDADREQNQGHDHMPRTDAIFEG